MIQEGKAGSVGELLEEVRRIGRVWTPSMADPSEIWFRGQGHRNHSLLPALYRTEALSFHYDEATLFERFRVVGSPYVHRLPSDDWEWYFLARHHGLPSRLLDWSESLLVAAYFALSGHLSSRNRLEVERQMESPRGPALHDELSPCIWMMDAGTLNKSTCGEDMVYVPGGPRTARYLPDAIAKSADSMNANPVAILPPRTNQRITAQQGMFTLHGHSQMSLDAVASLPGSVIQLGCISMDHSGLCHIWHDLHLLGMGKLGLFPELDSVAAHVAWVCQSEN